MFLDLVQHCTGLLKPTMIKTMRSTNSLKQLGVKLTVINVKAESIQLKNHELNFTEILH